MAGLVFVGCAQAFMLAFGSALPQFSTLIDSSMTLVRMLLGDFDLGALRRVAPFTGPLLFLIFIFLVCFVLLNMFVAILSEAYMKAKVCVFGDRIYKQDEEKWVGVPPFLFYVKLKLKEAVNGFFMLPFQLYGVYQGWRKRNQVGNEGKEKQSLARQDSHALDGAEHRLGLIAPVDRYIPIDLPKKKKKIHKRSAVVWRDWNNNGLHTASWVGGKEGGPSGENAMETSETVVTILKRIEVLEDRLLDPNATEQTSLEDSILGKLPSSIEDRLFDKLEAVVQHNNDSLVTILEERWKSMAPESSSILPGPLPPLEPR
eukprot:SAG11_NODE_1113_length_5809_cov_37.515672_3_plen_316_part_00